MMVFVLFVFFIWTTHAITHASEMRKIIKKNIHDAELERT